MTPDSGPSDIALVIGGTGFVGSHLVASLRREGTDVRVMGRTRPPGLAGQERGLIVGDLANRGQLTAALQGVSVVYHLASSTIPVSSAADPAFDIETNVVASIPLIEACVKSGIRLIFTSSGGTVYGLADPIPIPEDHPTFPVSTHGVGKLAVEKLLYAFGCTDGLDYRILRLANVYGDGQRPNVGFGAVATFLARVLAGLPVRLWASGSHTRDFVYVEDVVGAIIQVAKAPSLPYRVFNIGSGAGTRVHDLLDLVSRVAGRGARVEYLPARAFDVPFNVLDIQRASDTFGYSPQMTLEDGVRRTKDWLVSRRSTSDSSSGN